MSTRDARLSLLAGLYAAVATGSFYGFSVYSVSLKHQCGLSQHELSNVNTLPYAIGLVSPIFGAMGRFFGGRLSLFIGGVIVAALMSGQFALATHCDGAVRSAAPILLVLASCGTYTGLQFITAFAFPTPVLFWPRNRSQVTATAKSFVATGGAVIAQTYRLFYGVPTSSPTALNCMIMWAAASFGCATVAALAMPRPSRIPTASGSSGEAEEPRRALNFAFGEIALLGLFATVTPLVADGIAHDGLVFGMWLLTLLPIPIILITPSRWRAPSVASASINNPSSSAFTTALLMPAAIDVPAAAAPSAAEPCSTAAEPTSLIQQSSGGGESSKQYTLCEMLCTLDCWLLWSVGVVVIGSGSMLATNLAFIIEAADAPTHLVTTTATTFATGNLLGRLLTPVASDVLLVNRGWARPWLLLPVALTCLLAQLALLWAGTGKASAALQQVLLISGAAANGYAFGAMWPMLVVLSSELFGRKHLILNYLFYDGGCAAIGNLLIANLLPSFVYTHTAGGSGKCIGPKCFAPTHEAIAGMCGMATVSAAVLALRSRGVYRR